MKLHLLSLPPDNPTRLLEVGNNKPYRVKQLNQWVYRHLVTNWDDMTNLPKASRQAWADAFDLEPPVVVKTLTAPDGTVKCLLGLKDGNQVEMVLIPTEKKLTLCISSQVGCTRACAFCATARLGFKRSLDVSEIVGQVLVAMRMAQPRKVTNIVFMGMGEPLDNLPNVLESLKILQAEQGFCFSPRRVSVSTCGLPQQILDLAASGVKCKLAVSLNAAQDSKRNQLMPVNHQYNLAALKASLQEFRGKTSYRVTLEYILIKDFNMSAADIDALAAFAGDLSCKYNFIPYNPVPGLPYLPPSENEIDAFVEALASKGLTVTVRRSRGSGIAAACGQLAAQNYPQE